MLAANMHATKILFDLMLLLPSHCLNLYLLVYTWDSSVYLCPFFFVSFFFQNLLSSRSSCLAPQRRRTMPEVFAPTDTCDTPPSPVGSSPRRLSWGKLVQRLADFNTNTSSIESGSSHGSRSDLSDSGEQRFSPDSLLLEVVSCVQVLTLCFPISRVGCQ